MQTNTCRHILPKHTVQLIEKNPKHICLLFVTSLNMDLINLGTTSNLEYAVHAMMVRTFMLHIFWFVSKGRLKKLSHPRYGCPKFLKLSEFQVRLSLRSPDRPRTLAKDRATFSDLFLLSDWIKKKLLHARIHVYWKISVVCQRGFLANKQQDN